MVLSKDDFMSAISNIVGDDTSDDSLSLVENLTDTYNSLEAQSNGSENWEQKYNELDETWRKKYKERFFAPTPDPEPDPEPEPDPTEKLRSYSQLFN